MAIEVPTNWAIYENVLIFFFFSLYASATAIRDLTIFTSYTFIFLQTNKQKNWEKSKRIKSFFMPILIACALIFV